MRITPTIEADKVQLANLLSLGASFFPVTVYYDPTDNKSYKIPNVKEWQKTSNFSIKEPKQLLASYAYGFHPETIGAYVIDLDDKGVDGEKNLLDALGGPCPEISSPSVYVDTPNGRHVYFSNGGCDDILQSKNALLPGVDVRADHSGGWLVAPGSVGYSYKHEGWSLYTSEGDFSNLPIMPLRLHDLLASLFKHTASPDVLPSFISKPSAGEVLQAPEQDPKVELLFKLARMAETNADCFSALITKYVPEAVFDGRDYVTGDYSGVRGGSCKWTPGNGIIKDFNDPMGKGGDFIWWLSEYKEMSTVEAAREILAIASIPDPTGVPSIGEVRAAAAAQANAEAISAITGEYPLTDSGNAERLIESSHGNLRYNVDEISWTSWDGMKWNNEIGTTIQRLSKQVARSMAAQAMALEDTVKARALAKWAISSESRSRRESMCNLAQSEAGVPIREEDFNRDLDLLNTRSGIVNLKTSEIVAHDKSFFMSQICPMEVSFEKPTQFIEFMHQITDGREELYNWMHAFLGYCLTGQTKEQIFPIWWGRGANGKSQLLIILEKIMGDYCKPMSTDTILRSGQNSGGPRDDLAALKGARFVWTAEPDERKALSTETVKSITGSDRISCRQLYGRPFSYTPTYKPILVTNHKPQVRTQDNGTWRRLRFIPFTYQVPEDKRVPDIALKILEEEGPQILGYLIEGAMFWYEDGKLPYCEDIIDATMSLRTTDDPLNEFIMDMLIEGRGTVVPFDLLWSTYAAWLREKNIINGLPRTLFKRLIEERPGVSIKNYSLRTVVEGIGIRDKNLS